MAYRLMAHPRLARDLDRTPPRIAAELRKALDAFAQNPEGRQDIKRIQGVTTMPPTLRLRVGTYRIPLKIDHPRKEIIVLRLGPCNTVYRGLEYLD